MRVDAHIACVRAKVRGTLLAEHDSRRLEGATSEELGRATRGFAFATSLGPPKLHDRVLDGALTGFTAGFLDARHLEMPGRLEAGLYRARNTLALEAERLVERTPADAALTAIVAEGPCLHVIACGPSRVYLKQRAMPKRLVPREDPAGGLLRATPYRCSVELEEGDILLAGSVTAFSTDAIATVGRVLERDPRTPASVLASLLVEPASTAGQGALALVARFR